MITSLVFTTSTQRSLFKLDVKMFWLTPTYVLKRIEGRKNATFTSLVGFTWAFS